MRTAPLANDLRQRRRCVNTTPADEKSGRGVDHAGVALHECVRLITRVVGARRHPVFSSPAFLRTSRLTVLTDATTVIRETGYFARGRRVLEAGDGIRENGDV